MDYNTKFNRLKRILVSYGLVVDKAGAKGSEVKISDPLRTHKRMRIGKHGRNPEIAKQVIGNIRRKFQLTAEDGVSDQDFYGRG